MIRRRTSKGTPPESIDEQVRAYDEAARDAAWKWRHEPFDHTERSIELLEEMLAELHDDIQRPTFKRRLGLGPGEVEMEAWANLWGIYLGETLRARLGGRWISGHEEAPHLLALELPDGTVAFPTARVFRRLCDGAAESVLDYYRRVVLDAA